MYWLRTIYCAVLSWLLIGCQTHQQPRIELARRSQPLLGTFVTITAYGPDKNDLHRAISAAFDEFRRVDALLSVHDPNSELSRLNARAGQGAVQVSAELHDAIVCALELAEKTSGAFDPTVGPLTELWGFIWKEYRLPTQAELERVLPLIGYSNVIPRLPDRVILAKPGMKLDFGGIGKGIAVDRAVDALRERGVQAAMVRAGGDLRVFGLPPGRKSWTVQIEDPRKLGRRRNVELTSGALSTSGNYENYLVIEGTRYSHILDPRTGLPARGAASCTVIAPTCAESDALATAFSVLGPARSLARFGREFDIRFVTDDPRVLETANFGASRGDRTKTK